MADYTAATDKRAEIIEELGEVTVSLNLARVLALLSMTSGLLETLTKSNITPVACGIIAAEIRGLAKDITAQTKLDLPTLGNVR